MTAQANAEAAVVTGASSGIGEACARRLLDAGATVITLQRSPPKLQHPNLHFRRIDLADLPATKQIAAQVAADFPVRYLVNNAGANRPALLEDATAAKYGRVVNISSRAALGKTSRTVYASAKAGLIGMTRTIAIELGGDGITVNAVVPGPVASDLFPANV